jgi:hypothetical protein
MQYICNIQCNIHEIYTTLYMYYIEYYTFNTQKYMIREPLKDQGVFFSKNAPNLPFLAQEAQMKFFSFFYTFNCRILH